MSGRKIYYKYKPFNQQTLEMLVCDYIYCADPTTFNDPLDTKPCVTPDISVVQLEKVLRKLIENRVCAEMHAAALSIKYCGSKTSAHILSKSEMFADDEIESIKYDSNDPSYDGSYEEILSFKLTICIQKEILKIYENGIFSLAQRWNCPLMWSYYGDQHKGICIGYKPTKRTKDKTFKVQYGGTREVKASKILAMLNGDKEARVEVDQNVLLRKGPGWGYEEEWRFIDNRGEIDSPFELAEIIFGCRCPDFVKFALASALSPREGVISFYEIYESPGLFKLKSREVDFGEINVTYPRNNHAARVLFEQYFGKEVSDSADEKNNVCDS